MFINSFGAGALRRLRHGALALSAALLAACGSNLTGDVSGTAAVGAPLANATVSLLCGSGGTPTTATTNSSGNYNMTLGSTCSAPYFLKVVGVDTSVTPNVTTTLYAFADAAGNINITPLTDIAARFATGNNPDAEFEAVKAASKKAGDLWNSATAAEGKAKLLETLAALGLNSSGISDLLHGAFKAVKGDKTDDLLEALKARRGGVSLADLADRALKLGGSPGDKPWNALFRVGQNEIKLNMTGCRLSRSSYTYGTGEPGTDSYVPATSTQSLTTVTSAVLTLTRSAESFTASITPNAADTTQTFAAVLIDSAPALNTEASFTLLARAGTSNLGASGLQYFNPQVSVYQYLGFEIIVQSRQEIRDFAVQPRSSIASFYNNASNSAGYSNMSLDCDTVANPLTRSNVGSFQPQSRLASVASVSPTMTLTAALALNSNGGLCTTALDQPRSDPVVALPAPITYTYTVSTEGAISLNGVNVGDFLSASTDTGAFYYERTDFYNQREIARQASVAFDNQRGFYVRRDAKGGSRQYCGTDD